MELIELHVKQLPGLSAPIKGDTVEISTQFQGYRSNNDQQRAALWDSGNRGPTSQAMILLAPASSPQLAP